MIVNEFDKNVDLKQELFQTPRKVFHYFKLNKKLRSTARCIAGIWGKRRRKFVISKNNRNEDKIAKSSLSWYKKEAIEKEKEMRQLDMLLDGSM
jgi:hypothetical protein